MRTKRNRLQLQLVEDGCENETGKNAHGCVPNDPFVQLARAGTQPRGGLCRFGRSRREGRDNYLGFLRQGLGEIDTDWLVDKVRLSNAGVERKDQPGCWVIGDREFVVAVTAKNRERLALTQAAREQWDIGDVAERMAAEAGVSVADLRRRGRKSAGIGCRKKFAYICCRVLQFPVIGVASFLGTSGPAVSWAIREGEKLVTAEDVRKWTILPPG